MLSFLVYKIFTFYIKARKTLNVQIWRQNVIGVALSAVTASAPIRNYRRAALEKRAETSKEVAKWCDIHESQKYMTSPKNF
jgi:hypothetical protein